MTSGASPNAIKEDTGSPQEEQTPSSPKTTSFQGRLQLQDFMYSTSSSNGAPRRSARQGSVAASPTAATASPSPSQSPSKRATTGAGVSKRKGKAKSSSGYAPPSTYAHLSHLPDRALENLLVFFVGLNPGIQTARSGHAYAHPTNLFWKLLYTSGVTPRPCRPEEDGDMPRLYSLGFTNIVSRPSRNGAELSKQEMDDGVAALQEKARKWRPESMCVVGKSIWESIWRVRHGRPVGARFKYGWQDESENMGVIEGEWAGARVFVASSTSGLAATLSPAEKQDIWNQLGSWVKTRRAERAAEAEAGGEQATQ